jgi:hypothetical protein
MRATRFRHIGPIGALLAGLLLAGAAAAQAGQGARAQDLPALRGIERGMWELRVRGSTAPPRKVCVADPAMLMQVQHGTGVCSRFVIDSQANRATVHYTCPGAGHGRTTIRVETNHVLQIESQGIASNAPFNVSYEARHAGACR